MILRFGDYELDAARFELREGGRLKEVEPKPLELLLHLAEHRHRVVTREELLQRLWPDVRVGREALFYCLSKARHAVGDDGRCQGVIRTVRGEGLRFVAPVEHEERAPADAEPVTAIGREGLLTRLQSQLRSALEGRGQALLLAGPAGIGKTHTADALGQWAPSLGVEVRKGWAYRGAGAPALWPWLQILEGLVKDRGAPGIARLAGGRAPLVGRVLPGIAPPVEPPALQPEGLSERLPLYRALADLMVQASCERALLLILDDLHWADPASFLLLELLLERLSEARILLIGAFRDDEVASEHPLLVSLESLARHQVGEVLRLGPLSREDADRLVRASTSFVPSQAVVDSICSRSGGSPLLLTQLCAHLFSQEPGAAAVESGGPGVSVVLDRLAELPPGLELILQERIDRVSPRSRSLLELAALIGEEFEFELLSRAGPDSHAVAVASLEEASRSRLIEISPHGAARFRFVHPLFREVLLARLGVRRIRMHAALGRGLEALHAERPDPPLAQLAHHFYEASTAGCETEAIAYGVRAAQAARRQLAFEEALAQYGRMLELMGRTGREAPQTRIDILLEVCELRQILGDPEGAGRASQEAAALARKHGDAERLALVALQVSRTPDWMGEVDRSRLALIEEALAMLPEAGPTWVRLRLRVLVYLAEDPASRPRAESLLGPTLEAARAVGDDRVLLEALLVWTRVQRVWGSPDVPARLAACTEAVELATKLGNDLAGWLVHSQRVTPLMELGDVKAADAQIECIAMLSQRIGTPVGRSTALMFRTMRCLLRGEYEPVEALAREMLESRGQGSLLYWMAAFASLLFALRHEQGRLTELEGPMRALAERFPGMPTLRAALALGCAETGDLAAARRLLETLAADDFAVLPGTESWRVGAAILCRVAYKLRDAERAAALYRLLEPVEPYCLVLGEGALCLGPAAYPLALAAETCGEWERASRHFEAAVARSEAMGASPWAAHARFDHARMLCVRLGPGDRERARELIARARATAQALGMSYLLGELAHSSF